jgi:copper homeostasis protein (lipoprotein)
MKDLKIILGLLVILVLTFIFFQAIGFVYEQIPKAEKTTMVQESNSPDSVMQIYNGILPCENCQGINTEITFIRKIQSKGEINGEYILLEQYIGEQESPIIKEGGWSGEILQNGETIITVNVQGENRYFLLEEDSILMLDSEKRTIQNNLNYRLQRI